jgi:hypothetical protein
MATRNEFITCVKQSFPEVIANQIIKKYLSIFLSPLTFDQKVDQTLRFVYAQCQNDQSVTAEQLRNIVLFAKSYNVILEI